MERGQQLRAYIALKDFEPRCYRDELELRSLIARCFQCYVSESPVDPLAVRQHGADDYSPVMESKDDCAVVTSLELIRLWPRVVLTFEPSETCRLALAFGSWLRAVTFVHHAE
jgi:hypothetical protein